MEKETKALIKDYLLKAGHLVFNVFQCKKNNFGNKKGIADLIGCLKGGKFYCVEVKAKGGTLSDEQAEFLDWVRRTGGIAIVAYSLDDVKRGIK